MIKWGAFLVPGTVWSAGVNGMNTGNCHRCFAGAHAAAQSIMLTPQRNRGFQPPVPKVDPAVSTCRPAHLRGELLWKVHVLTAASTLQWITQSTRKNSLENKPLAILATDGQTKMDRYCQQKSEKDNLVVFKPDNLELVEKKLKLNTKRQKKKKKIPAKMPGSLTNLY